tara:strand:+ start:4920 stop:5579 length:660 start_codon:yes stop_codon:yes gene_type:complete
MPNTAHNMRTLIFTTPSTGSTEFKSKLCKRNNYDINFGEILNERTFKKKLSKNIINKKEWQEFCEEHHTLDYTEQLAQFQIKRFTESKNCIAKLFPDHLHLLSIDLISKYCSKLCDVADKIFYLQRENKKEQIVSRSVRFINGVPDKKLMYTYKGDLSNDILNENFEHYKKNINIIEKIFKKYPGDVITLEKDVEDTTFQNRYVYKGDWQLPEELPLLS